MLDQTVRHHFVVIPEEEGGFTILFPDLPGCLTQIESLEELPEMVEDAYEGWIEALVEDERDLLLIDNEHESWQGTRSRIVPSDTGGSWFQTWLKGYRQ